MRLAPEDKHEYNRLLLLVSPKMLFLATIYAILQPMLGKKKTESTAKLTVPKTTVSSYQKTHLFQYIANEEHYDRIIEKIASVKKHLWIGTADIKDLYVKDGRYSKPLLAVLSDLAERGVEIRLIHAKEPGPAFRKDFDKYPNLIEGVERVLCPRVHFKIIIFDMKTAYVGSANLTGAGLGMKGENTRNFEAGVLSSDRDFVKAAVHQFDEVWMGAFCANCRRKQFCADPIC
jgi:phosphatidylserine/phosphatidylglycerophosphate/cardiolipin synthase-like enzyme